MDPIAVVALIAGLVVSGVLGGALVRQRHLLEQATQSRALEVTAGVDAELTRRQRDIDDRVDLLRSNAQAEADRTRALAAAALAAAEQSRAQAADDVRRAEERRAAIENESSTIRADIERLRDEVTRMRDEVSRREDRLIELVRAEAAILNNISPK